MGKEKYYQYFVEGECIEERYEINCIRKIAGI